MTEQQLNDVWTYIQTEPMESAIITDSEGFAVGYIVGTGVDPKKSAEELAWRIVADHNLNLMAMHANGWTPTNGQEPDLPGGTLVDVKFADGHVASGRRADYWIWMQDGRSSDITHYRIHRSEPAVQGEPVASAPVAAQHRFRHPQKSTRDWSPWQPAAIRLDRPSWEIDSQGYEVEYRLLYDAPQPAESDEERLAMEAVMESVDPATWPGLTTAQRCALGRFAKPQPTEQQPVGEMISDDGDIYWTDQHPPMGTKLYATPQPAEQQSISTYAYTVPDDCETLHWRGQILSMNELVSVQPAPGVTALVEALTELCDEIDNHEIHTAISKTNILWFKRKARAALAAHRKQQLKGEDKQ